LGIEEVFLRNSVDIRIPPLLSPPLNVTHRTSYKGLFTSNLH